MKLFVPLLIALAMASSMGYNMDGSLRANHGALEENDFEAAFEGERMLGKGKVCQKTHTQWFHSEDYSNEANVSLVFSLH